MQIGMRDNAEHEQIYRLQNGMKERECKINGRRQNGNNEVECINQIEREAGGTMKRILRRVKERERKMDCKRQNENIEVECIK